MIVLYEHHDSFDMCSVVKGGFGYIFNGSVHYLPINEAHYLLAAGISWSVALSCLSIFLCVQFVVKYRINVLSFPDFKLWHLLSVKFNMTWKTLSFFFGHFCPLLRRLSFHLVILWLSFLHRAKSRVQFLLCIWCRYYAELGSYDCMVCNSWLSYHTRVYSVHVLCSVDDDVRYDLLSSGLWSLSLILLLFWHS